MTSLCSKCKEHCCIGEFGTFITIEDAERISKFTDKKMSEFCFYGPISSNERYQKQLMKDKDHSYLKFAKNGLILQLKTKKNDECIFLNELKCGIYESRPLICRIFPIGYKKNGNLCFVEEDEYCHLLNKNCLKETAKNIGLTISNIQKIVNRHLKEIKRYKGYEKYFIEGLKPEEVSLKIKN